METGSGMLLADPTQMHQVMMNLCTNAAHAMREKGGILQVNLTNVNLDSEDVSERPNLGIGPYVRLTVSDTGHGMDRNTAARIFDPYFTTKKPGEGTGLGLAVVHGIVRKCGGDITVHSELGEGTTFQIHLPRIGISESPEGEEELAVPPAGEERILFVDDEENLANIGRDMLEYLGYEVVAETSSVEALHLFRTQPDRFDLVITDMTMPHMTGDRLATELLRIRPDIPIILCTGFSEGMTEERVKKIGIRESLMKPLVIQMIAEKARKVLNPGFSKG